MLKLTIFTFLLLSCNVSYSYDWDAEQHMKDYENTMDHYAYQHQARRDRENQYDHGDHYEDHQHHRGNRHRRY